MRECPKSSGSEPVRDPGAIRVRTGRELRRPSSANAVRPGERSASASTGETRDRPRDPVPRQKPVSASGFVPASRTGEENCPRFPREGRSSRSDGRLEAIGSDIESDVARLEKQSSSPVGQTLAASDAKLKRGPRIPRARPQESARSVRRPVRTGSPRRGLRRRPRLLDRTVLARPTEEIDSELDRLVPADSILPDTLHRAPPQPVAGESASVRPCLAAAEVSALLRDRVAPSGVEPPHVLAVHDDCRRGRRAAARGAPRSTVVGEASYPRLRRAPPLGSPSSRAPAGGALRRVKLRTWRWSRTRSQRR